MKPWLTLPGLLLVLLSGDRSELICRTWKQIGIKSFHKAYHAIDPSMAEVMTFNKDGTYDETLYGQMRIKGEWAFDSSSTKLKFAVTAINGVATPNMTLQQTKPTDTILNLTKDTLVYGHLVYLGEAKEYGHDDLYFVAAGK